MNHTLRYLFFLLVVRPVVLIVLGLNIRRHELLPRGGPAIVVANHNSHLDAFALMSLFPLRLLPRLRPVAAADYFFKNAVRAWFATKIVGIIPLQRDVKKERRDPLCDLSAALERGEILVLFPEGSRGQPEQRAEFKTGVAHLAKRHPEVPVTAVFMHGLGKSLPRGERVLVPFFCDIFVGEPVTWTGDRESFMNLLNERFDALASEARIPEWK